MSLYFLVDENNIVTNASEDAGEIDTIVDSGGWILAPEDATMESILGFTYDSESGTFS
jgi:hypothetical protein